MASQRLRRALYPAYRKLETFVHPLRYLFLEVTQRCNLACRHCGSDCGREARSGELSTAEWLRFFAELPKRFDLKKLVAIVTGGEPLCHPDIDKLLGGLGEQGIRFGVVTNGWALSEKNVARLVGHGLHTATVSLDGLAERHDWLRGKKGSFERAVAGIERLAKAGLPFFDVVTCVHPGNLDELGELSLLLQRLGVPAWRLFAIFPKGRAKENGELMLGEAGFRQLTNFIARERQRAPQGFRVSFSCEAYLPADVDAAVRDEPYFCRAGIAIGSVLCDGAISACPNITRELVQGNIRTDDFAEVWEKRFLPYRERGWMKQGECGSCGEWKRCLGNSMHLWDAEAGRTGCCAHHVLADDG